MIASTTPKTALHGLIAALHGLIAALLTFSLPLQAELTATHQAEPTLPALGKPQPLTPPDQVPQGLAKSDWQSIRAAYEAGRHSFQPVEGGWQARNPGQQWTTTFDQRGFVAQPQGGGWTWGLELQSYGFGERQQRVKGTPQVKAEGQRLSYQWDARVQEWFVNDQRGLEHGFTVSQRPDQTDPTHQTDLSFLLSTRGGLTPRITADASGVSFETATGATALTYSGLKVWDADGKILPARFESAGPQSFRLRVDESGARYPITIDPIAQQAYLKASNTASNDGFARALAIDADTVVIGAQFEDSGATGVGGNQADNSVNDSGAVYVFTRSAGVWTQQAYIKASNPGANDFFGQPSPSLETPSSSVPVGRVATPRAWAGIRRTTPNSFQVPSMSSPAAPGCGASRLTSKPATRDSVIDSALLWTSREIPWSSARPLNPATPRG